MNLELKRLSDIYKISHKVIRILGCNPGFLTLQGTNTYLVGTGKRRVLIDTGGKETAGAYTGLLQQVLKQEKATIEHLVITHWHPDHIGGVDSVQQLLKATAKPATVWKLPRSPKDSNISELEKSVKWEPLSDEQVMEVEGAKLTVKHTPGHSTDHACLLLDDNTLFSGDCILGQGSAVFEDLHDYMQSLKKILDMKPQTIYPGHGPIVDEPIKKIQDYIDHRNAREKEILEFLQKNEGNSPISEEDIADSIYKNVAKELRSHCISNTVHHLEKLVKEGKVVGQTGSWKCSAFQ